MKLPTVKIALLQDKCRGDRSSAAGWRIWAGDPPVRDTVPHPEGGGLPSRGGRVKTAYPGEI